jgi:hypothetical protein
MKTANLKPLKPTMKMQKAPTPDLDAMLTVPEAARWLRMSVKSLLNNVRTGRIPAVRVNDRVLRFHPRTVLVAMATRPAGPEIWKAGKAA